MKRVFIILSCALTVYYIASCDAKCDADKLKKCVRKDRPKREDPASEGSTAESTTASSTVAGPKIGPITIPGPDAKKPDASSTPESEPKVNTLAQPASGTTTMKTTKRPKEKCHKQNKEYADCMEKAGANDCKEGGFKTEWDMYKHCHPKYSRAAPNRSHVMVALASVVATLTLTVF